MVWCTVKAEARSRRSLKIRIFFRHISSVHQNHKSHTKRNPDSHKKDPEITVGGKKSLVQSAIHPIVRPAQ